MHSGVYSVPYICKIFFLAAMVKNFSSKTNNLNIMTPGAGLGKKILNFYRPWFKTVIFKLLVLRQCRMINYHPYPEMESPVVLLCSDRAIAALLLSIAAWQQHSSQNDIQEKNISFHSCSTHPTFPPSDLLLTCRKSQWMHIIWWKNDSRHHSYP